MSSKPIQDLRDDMAALVRAVDTLGKDLRRIEDSLNVRLDGLAANDRARADAYDALTDAVAKQVPEIVDRRVESMRIGLKAAIDERMSRCGVCAEQIGVSAEATT
jgi:hypothetical protein